MANSTFVTNPVSVDDQSVNQLNFLSNTIDNLNLKDNFSLTYSTEEQNIMTNYVKQLFPYRESEMLVLSPSHHYFYDSEEMKNVRIVTTLKELNKINNLKGFLGSLYSNLQPNSFFIGHFINYNIAVNFKQDSKNQGLTGIRISEDIDNGIVSRFAFLNRIYNILDARSFYSLSSNTVEHHLRNSGFRVVDMTRTRMITCFCAQRQP